MKLSNKNIQDDILFVKLKDDNWIENQKIAAISLNKIMKQLECLIAEKTNLSMLEIDKFVENEIIKDNCFPTFKGYRGFPNSVCISVNKQLVHGIPNNYKLQEGDLVTFDFGVTYKEAIVDSAHTFIFGQAKNIQDNQLINTTKECLLMAIKSIKIGERLGNIGNSIYKTAKNKNYNVIENYTGHFICSNKPHAKPYVLNKDEKYAGIRFINGMTFAIEPLLIDKKYTTKTRIDSDGWTVLCENICAHEEHTVTIYNDKVHVLTDYNNEIHI